MNKGKKNQKQEQPAITQEDRQTTDPFLRALAKKVRNLNKKIADIETLEKREDLKPEQQEKINSKPSIIEQRKKYEQFAKFYKTTLAEANKEQANQTNPVILKVSNAIITAQILQTGATLGNVQFTANEKSILSNIGNIGAEESNLRSLTSNLSSYLGQYLDNQKLVTKIEQAYSNQDLLNTNITLTSSNSSNQVQTKVNTHKNTPKKQQKTTEKQTIQTQQVVAQQLKQPIVSVPTVEQTSTPTQIQTPVQPVQQVNSQTNNDNLTTQPTIINVSGQNTANEVKQQDRRPQRNNQYQKKYDSNRPVYKPKDGYRQNGNRDGGYREGGYKNYKGDRKYDKPKYQEKQEQQDDRRSDTSLEDSEDEANKRRRFNNKEINSLQNDGFIVVQKRPKANEQQEYNKKQHGYKDRKPVYNH